MKLLLDQGLPRSCVGTLRAGGFDAAHVGDLGLAKADDTDILEQARKGNMVVVTLDADFHALMAVSGSSMPSVIRIRIEGLRAAGLAELLSRVVRACRRDIEAGALITVAERRLGLRRLPIVPRR